TFHPEMGKGLPPVELIKDLASLVEFLKGKKTVQEPEPAKVEKALEREKRKEAKVSDAILRLSPIQIQELIHKGFLVRIGDKYIVNGMITPDWGFAKSV